MQFYITVFMKAGNTFIIGSKAYTIRFIGNFVIHESFTDNTFVAISANNNRCSYFVAFTILYKIHLHSSVFLLCIFYSSLLKNFCKRGSDFFKKKIIKYQTGCHKSGGMISRNINRAKGNGQGFTIRGCKYYTMAGKIIFSI